MLTHGRAEEAEQVVAEIEDEVRKTHPQLPEPEGEPLTIAQREHIGFLSIAKYVVKNYPSRGVLGLSLMTGQAFLYNAVFFTYTLVLSDFFGVKAEKAPLFLIPFAAGNILGPLTLGPLFDSIGRKVMIFFPLEARAMAIALFYAVGTGIAALSPTLFGALAVAAERKALEDIARPLTAVRTRIREAGVMPARAR